MDLVLSKPGNGLPSSASHRANSAGPQESSKARWCYRRIDAVVARLLAGHGCPTRAHCRVGLMAVLLKESATFPERVGLNRSDCDRFRAGVITLQHQAAMVKPWSLPTVAVQVEVCWNVETPRPGGDVRKNAERIAGTREGRPPRARHQPGHGARHQTGPAQRHRRVPHWQRRAPLNRGPSASLGGRSQAAGDLVTTHGPRVVLS